MQQEKYYVYTLAYPDGRVFYIGKGVGRRIHHHEAEARRTSEKTHKLNTIRKIWAQGGQVLKKQLAHFATDDEACQYEIALVFFMNANNHLTNRTDGGDTSAGLKHTQEARRKISEARRGKPGNPLSAENLAKMHAALRAKGISEETRRRMSEAQKNLPSEVRARMNAALKGRVYSEEGKRQLSLAQLKRRDEISRMNTGRKRTAEARRKMSESRRGKPRGPHSEETKRKISAKHKGKTLSLEHRQKLAAHRPSEEQRRRVSETLKGRPGRPHTEETKSKIREKNRGKQRTLEMRAQMSESRQGRTHSEETRLKLSQKLKGRVISEEHRQKLSEAAKKRREDPEYHQKMSEAAKKRESAKAAKRAASQGMEVTK